MKNFILAFVSLLYVSHSYSQTTSENVSVLLGSNGREPSKSTISDIIGTANGKVFMVRNSFGFANGNFFVESYDEKMNLIIRTEQHPEMDNDKFNPEECVLFGNDLLLFSSNHNKKTDQLDIYYQVLDQSTLISSASPQLIASVPSSSVFKYGSFDLIRSPDRSKLVLVKQPPYDKNNPDRISAVVFEAGMKKLWEKDFALPYSDKLFATERYVTDNGGNFYLMGRLYEDKVVEKRDGKPNYTYHIIAWYNQGETMKENLISMKDHFITDLTMKIANNGNIVCGGFYSDAGTFSIRGTYFATIDFATQQISLQGIREFEKDFLAQFMNSSKAEKGKELDNYNLDNMILRSDGGVLLLAEQFYITQSTSTTYINGIPQTSTTYYYHYRSIIVVNVNPDMTIAWATKIPKEQITRDDGGYFSSYSFMITGSNIYIVFNDNPKNLSIKDAMKIYPYNRSQSVAMLVTLNANGEWNKSVLFSNKDKGVILKPSVAEQVSENEMVIYAELGKDYLAGKLTFK